MDDLALESNYIPHLREQFSNGSVVLFLGAGFSLEAKSVSGHDLPSARDLTEQLWDLCFPADPFDSTTQLQDIFETARNLKSKDLTHLLRDSFTVDPDSCPEWYLRLLTMPWLRIYTLNIDDLVLKVLTTMQSSRRVRAVSATSDRNPLFDDSHLSIIHLNGTLEDIPDDVTFSRSQYAQRTGLDPAYAQLKNDLLFRCVVFVGASMEEGPMWQHLGLRGPSVSRGERELRPRSYLVLPTLNRSKESLLARHNVAWLPMVASEFESSILNRMDDQRTAGHRVLREIGDPTTSRRERFDRVADLAAAGDSSAEEYLLGAEPIWDDVSANRVANRTCFDELWNQLNELRASGTNGRFLVITGTAGTGKSSALMSLAMRLEADGTAVAWLDASSVFSRFEFRKALANEPQFGAIFINDSDIYDARLSSMVRDTLEHNPRLIIVCETRSGRVDRIVNRQELNDIECVEYTIPSLVDDDIDAILDVLDREQRLGQLKGMSRDERRRVFQRLAGRQLLVAMHIATHGKNFEERAVDELREMPPEQMFMYGLVCVASAYRYTLRQEDIGIACSNGGTDWLQSLDALTRRKLILPHKHNSYRARHRVIAQFVYDSLVQAGKLHGVVSAIIQLAATKTTQYSPKTSQYARMLRTFLSHNLMKRAVGLVRAREIYSDFQDALDWSYHFWLHRGALELETDNLDRAENFLNQAKSINENDVFIDNELAYLAFKKAIAQPTSDKSAGLVDEAIATLNHVVVRRPDQMAVAFHIMGQQGLVWAKIGVSSAEKKKELLEYLKRKVERAITRESTEMMHNLANDIQRELLSLAV